MDLPKISVITAVYNGATHIERAIKSLVSQDYPHLEYIVIDGGSTDGTLNILEKYKDKIDILVSEPDEGNADAQNKGIRKSTGEVIAMLSSDDIYEEGILKKIGKAFAENPDAEIVSCGARIVKEGPEGSLQDIKLFQGNDISFTLESIIACPVTNARFLKKSVYTKYGYPEVKDKHGRYFLANDQKFFLDLALKNLRHISIDDIGYTFLSHDDSLTFTDNYQSSMIRYQQHLDIFEEFLEKQSLSSEQAAQFKMHHKKDSLRLAGLAIKTRKYKLLLETIKRGIALNHFVWIIRFLFKPVQLLLKSLSRKLRKV